MGDPAGIGPEIILKALSDPSICRLCRPVVLGDPLVLSVPGALTPTPHTVISHPQKALNDASCINVMALSQLTKEDAIPGQPTTDGGKAMVEYILKGVELAMQGGLAAIVTCPISKALMHKAGFPFDGHTGFIAHLTGSQDYVMMLAGEKLRVALVTTHCALKDVPALLDKKRILKTITTTFKALKGDFGIANPRLAVTALNPHAGESLLFGSEEEESIKPAVEEANKQGCRAEGPFPADTLFCKACDGQYDAVIAMYHDQGLIPLKMLHFSEAVNVTLGLPIIRTSVDHGTAYDIAGKGVAEASSLKTAIKMAVTMTKNRASVE